MDWRSSAGGGLKRGGVCVMSEREELVEVRISFVVVHILDYNFRTAKFQDIFLTLNDSALG